MPRRRRPGTAVLMGTGVLLAVLLGYLLTHDLTPAEPFDRWLSNLAQLLAGCVAAGAAGWRAITTAGRTRWSWLCLSLGTGAWALGQAWWCWVEIVRDGAAPFPSVADLGFLAFPLLAAVALTLHPTRDDAGRWQRSLDAAMTSAAVGLVSWQTTLGAVVAAKPGGGPLVAGLLVGYPVLDVLLIVLGVLTLARATTNRTPLALVVLGLVAFSVADSAFAYQAVAGGYAGSLLDLGWIAGFGLMTLAALSRPDAAVDPATQLLDTAEPGTAERRTVQRRPTRAAYLPYVPVALALVVTAWSVLRGRELDRWELLATGVLVALLLARQYLALQDNVRLATELSSQEAQLRHQAFHDTLTGLANRALFLDRLEHALALHARDLRAVSVVFLDLDDFKVVNDTLGHAAGDELLVRMAERLTGAARSGDTVARLGGDEFAVLLEDGGDPVQTAAKIIDGLGMPFQLCGSALEVHASVGICELAADDRPLAADELMARSDTAMYAAKRSGKDRIVSYSTGMSLAELADEKLRTALQRAIDGRTVRLCYQPIVELDTGRVVGLEALARWHHDGQDIPPDVFIPLAERTGLMTALTTDLLSAACGRIAVWSASRDEPLSVHVNIAPSQLVAPGFVATVTDLLRLHRLPTGALVLEITESGIFADLEAAQRTVAELRALGVGVSLDDFGVGYSSLAQLNAMPLDSVKIDRSFLAGVDTDARQAVFLHAVLRLADDIGLPVVAEGVERPAQLARLRALGCRHGQGWLLGRPVDASEVPALLAGPAVLTPA